MFSAFLAGFNTLKIRKVLHFLPPVFHLNTIFFSLNIMRFNDMQTRRLNLVNLGQVKLRLITCLVLQ